jgi:hypothetical protein
MRLSICCIALELALIAPPAVAQIVTSQYDNLSTGATPHAGHIALRWPKISRLVDSSHIQDDPRRGVPGMARCITISFMGLERGPH